MRDTFARIVPFDMTNPSPTTFSSQLDHALARLAREHLLRQRRETVALDSVHVEIAGQRLVNFASNDYLGLTRHKRIIGSSMEAIQHSGMGAGAAPLVTGYRPEHAALERELAAWKQTEAAILVPSGYQANLAAIGAVAAVGRPKVRFLLDKLAHASLIDSLRASEVRFRVFPHNFVTKLERLLKQADRDELQVVVTESIFSMDGDAADLPAIVALKRRHPFLLIVDEAHGSGVYGRNGAGYAAELGLSASVDLSIVTLSKAFGLMGGAVCASRDWCDAVVNFGRASVFSTALPPMIAQAARVALQIMRDEPHRQDRVRALAQRVRAGLKAAGCKLLRGDSPVIPLIVGSEAAALNAAEVLKQRGLLVPAIRPPTVPPGSSRLRVTVSCEHTDDEIQSLIETVSSVLRNNQCNSR